MVLHHIYSGGKPYYGDSLNSTALPRDDSLLSQSFTEVLHSAPVVGGGQSGLFMERVGRGTAGAVRSRSPSPDQLTFAGTSIWPGRSLMSVQQDWVSSRPIVEAQLSPMASELKERAYRRGRSFGSLEDSWRVKNAFASWRSLVHIKVTCMAESVEQQQRSAGIDSEALWELHHTIAEKDALIEKQYVLIMDLEKRVEQMTMQGQGRLRRAAWLSADWITVTMAGSQDPLILLFAFNAWHSTAKHGRVSTHMSMMEARHEAHMEEARTQQSDASLRLMELEEQRQLLHDKEVAARHLLEQHRDLVLRRAAEVVAGNQPRALRAGAFRAWASLAERTREEAKWTYRITEADRALQQVSDEAKLKEAAAVQRAAMALAGGNPKVIRASTFHAWSRCVTEMRLEREYAGQVNDLESRFAQEQAMTAQAREMEQQEAEARRRLEQQRQSLVLERATQKLMGDSARSILLSTFHAWARYQVQIVATRQAEMQLQEALASKELLQEEETLRQQEYDAQMAIMKDDAERRQKEAMGKALQFLSGGNPKVLRATTFMAWVQEVHHAKMERSFLEAKSELQAEHDRHVEHFQQQLSELEEEKNFLAKELNDRKELAETEVALMRDARMRILRKAAEVMGGDNPKARLGGAFLAWRDEVHTTKLEQEREVERRMFEDDRARLEEEAALQHQELSALLRLQEERKRDAMLKAARFLAQGNPKALRASAFTAWAHLKEHSKIEQEFTAQLDQAQKRHTEMEATWETRHSELEARLAKVHNTRDVIKRRAAELMTNGNPRALRAAVFAAWHKLSHSSNLIRAVEEERNDWRMHHMQQCEYHDGALRATQFDAHRRVAMALSSSIPRSLKATVLHAWAKVLTDRHRYTSKELQEQLREHQRSLQMLMLSIRNKKLAMIARFWSYAGRWLQGVAFGSWKRYVETQLRLRTRYALDARQWEARRANMAKLSAFSNWSRAAQGTRAIFAPPPAPTVAYSIFHAPVRLGEGVSVPANAWREQVQRNHFESWRGLVTEAAPAVSTNRYARPCPSSPCAVRTSRGAQSVSPICGHSPGHSLEAPAYFPSQERSLSPLPASRVVHTAPVCTSPVRRQQPLQSRFARPIQEPTVLEGQGTASVVTTAPISARIPATSSGCSAASGPVLRWETSPPRFAVRPGPHGTTALSARDGHEEGWSSPSVVVTTTALPQEPMVVGASATSVATGIHQRPQFGDRVMMEMAARRPEPIDRYFDEMDTNHDGVISRSEFQRAFEQEPQPYIGPVVEGPPPPASVQQRYVAATATSVAQRRPPEEHLGGLQPRQLEWTFEGPVGGCRH